MQEYYRIDIDYFKYVEDANYKNEKWMALTNLFADEDYERASIAPKKTGSRFELVAKLRCSS